MQRLGELYLAHGVTGDDAQDSLLGRSVVTHRHRVGVGMHDVGNGTQNRFGADEAIGVGWTHPGFGRGPIGRDHVHLVGTHLMEHCGQCTQFCFAVVHPLQQHDLDPEATLIFGAKGSDSCHQPFEGNVWVGAWICR